MELFKGTNEELNGLTKMAKMLDENQKKLSKLRIEVLKIDFNQVDNIVIDGICMADAPDYCDAFISSCDYYGIPATDQELDAINEDSGYVYEQVLNYML